MSFRNFTAFVFAASLVALTPTESLAQQNVTVDAVKKRAELNSAKADLEENTLFPEEKQDGTTEERNIL